MARRPRRRWSLALCGPLLALPACAAAPEPLGELPPVEPAPAAAVGRPLVLTHAGQGSPASWSSSARAGAEAGWASLAEGASASDAVLAAIHALEDDPRLNAGTGANLRLDGRTIECDAAVMDDTGRYGAVAGVRGVRHPVDLARAVSHTPHLLVAGEGARALARRLGLEPADLATERARRKLERALVRLFDPPKGDPWAGFDWRKHWNFEGEPPATLDEARARISAAGAMAPATAAGAAGADPATRDTVGAVVRTADGRYAAALSTGGTTLALRGRVGDVPQRGAGLMAGPAGAVAATGRGEAIVREQVASRVYDLLARGVAPRAAIQRATLGISAAEGVGVIAVSERGYAAWATSQMAWAVQGQELAEDAEGVVWRE